MKNDLKSTSAIYHLIITVAGLALLIFTTFYMPPRVWWGVLLASVIAFQVNFPLSWLHNEINLVQVLTLGLGLIFGPAVAGWAALIGIVAGSLFRQLRGDHVGLRHLRGWLDMGYASGIQIIPLVIALHASGWELGAANDSALRIWPDVWPSSLSEILYHALPVILFPLLQSALILSDVLLKQKRITANVLSDLGTLAMVEFLPPPFIAISVIAYPQTPTGVIIALSGLPTILAILMNRMSATQLELERRLQDLSTLNQVSQVLRSTINLDKLLNVIHQQVTQLMGVENFYVALFDEKEGRLWYPLAVKYGQRQNWAPRTLLPDRLTDRVIRDGKPILLTPQNRDALLQTGLPGSVENPEAWMGVPLISSDRTIGCLALFSGSVEAQFTNADLNLLAILSGQVSVAIENALLLDQAQRRATQLETLNRLTALITASLNTKDVLSQVCRAVAQVGGGQRSAIYLIDEPKNQVALAYGFGLSLEFTRRNEVFPLTQDERTRCLRTGRPALTPHTGPSALEQDFLDVLEREGIHAFGDFPLTTPDGHQGILSVYYEQPHTFNPEEVDLLQTFAAQAALAVSNARLYASADRALARRADQLAILESVGRELAAAISSSRLFDMILDYALKFTNSPWGELSLYNPQTDSLEVKASRGYLTSKPIFALEEGISGRALKTRQPVNVGDTQLEPGYIDLTKGSARSQLSVPMIHEERVLGVLTLESGQENAYSDADQTFVGQLATQAAVAVVNAELYRESQRRLREQSILYLISTHLVGNQELDSIIQTVARSMEAAVQNATVGIYLWDENERTYFSHYASPSPSRPNCHLPTEIAESDLTPIRPALVNTGFLRLPTESRGTDALLGRCTDCRPLVLPMVVKKQRLGMVLMHIPKDQTIQDEEIQLLHAVVAQVSISMQNALLFQDVTHGRDRLAAVLNSVGEGIVMLENSGRILLVNETVQVITGLPAEELIRKSLHELPAQALQPLGFENAEAETLARGLSQSQGINLPKKIIKIADLKPERVLERSMAPVWGEGGRVIGWMIVLRDVTEEYQIAEARELITQTLVHDLRSPVSAVLSAVDILETSLPYDPNDELATQAFRVARISAQRVLGLIESLLDIARLQSGKMELNLVALDLHHLAGSAMNEFLAQATDIGVIVRNDIAADLPKVRGDQSKITRVVTNLIDNALKFTPAGGQIVASAERLEDGMVAVRISDSGPGIPEEFRDKIFDRFTQIPGQAGRRRGSGLGLTFCRLAIEAHGGRIWVESRQGGGSVFILTLPISG